MSVSAKYGGLLGRDNETNICMPVIRNIWACVAEYLRRRCVPRGAIGAHRGEGAFLIQFYRPGVTKLISQLGMTQSQIGYHQLVPHKAAWNNRLIVMPVIRKGIWKSVCPLHVAAFSRYVVISTGGDVVQRKSCVFAGIFNEDPASKKMVLPARRERRLLPRAGRFGCRPYVVKARAAHTPRVVVDDAAEVSLVR